MKKYIVVIKLLDKKYSIDEKVYRTYVRNFESYRDLRDYLVKYNFYEHEYTVYEETDIKIKAQTKGICI